MSPSDNDATQTRLAFAGDAGAVVARPFKAAVSGFATVRWNPTEVVIEHPAAGAEEAVAATKTFDALIREILAIEGALRELEPLAAADVRYSFRIRGRDSGEWDRLLATLERLALFRLRIEPLSSALDDPPHSLSARGERLFKALVDAAELHDRLERLDGRLEALEDLYEGAVDRINDFRGWRFGHNLEVAIIILLLAEVVLLVVK
jgi:hypothetical protein